MKAALAASRVHAEAADRQTHPPGVLDNGVVRAFATGATRDTSTNKPDYEGFLSPAAIRRFGEYMMEHQRQSDGSIRPSDNWQKGIPLDVYVKSAWRHFHAVWEKHRSALIADGGIQEYDFADADLKVFEDDLCALWFNVQGLLHETLKLK